MIRSALYQAPATQSRCFVDKIITWGDASTEHVRVGQDGFISLDGVRKRLIGFHLGSSFDSGIWSDAANLTILHSELDYLVTKGVRIVEVDCWYSGVDNEDDWNATLDLLYQHKLLVVAGITHRQVYPTIFDSLSTVDFSLMPAGDETVSQQMPKWVDNILTYSNVIAISSESEPECPVGEQAYTVPLFVSYIQMVNAIIAAKTTLPILIKDVSNPPDWMVVSQIEFVRSMRDATLPYSAIPCADMYLSSAAAFASHCNIIREWYVSKGRNQQMWLGEINYADSGSYDASLLTKEMIDAILASNVSVLFLFAINYQADAGLSFFDAAGDPIANTETLMANLGDWQASI